MRALTYEKEFYFDNVFLQISEELPGKPIYILPLGTLKQEEKEHEIYTDSLHFICVCNNVTFFLLTSS